MILKDYVTVKDVLMNCGSNHNVPKERECPKRRNVALPSGELRQYPTHKDIMDSRRKNIADQQQEHAAKAERKQGASVKKSHEEADKYKQAPKRVRNLKSSSVASSSTKRVAAHPCAEKDPLATVEESPSLLSFVEWRTFVPYAS